MHLSYYDLDLKSQARFPSPYTKQNLRIGIMLAVPCRAMPLPSDRIHFTIKVTRRLLNSQSRQ